MIEVQVVHALPDEQRIYTVRVPEGATVADAIIASGLAGGLPAFAPGAHRFGVFGKVAAADRVLHAGDRVEIYRPLTADPKDARRNRVKRK